MRDLGKVLAHIPARAGSKRVKAKNLRLLSGNPMLQYAVEAAINSKVFDDIYVNSDSDEMLALAENLGVKGYKRDPELASDTATGDEFTIDFIRQLQPDTLVMISPVCPLVTSADIIASLEAFQLSSCDTLFDSQELAPYPSDHDLPLLDSIILQKWRTPNTTKEHLSFYKILSVKLYRYFQMNIYILVATRLVKHLG